MYVTGRPGETLRWMFLNNKKKQKKTDNVQKPLSLVAEYMRKPVSICIRPLIKMSEIKSIQKPLSEYLHTPK